MPFFNGKINNQQFKQHEEMKWTYEEQQMLKNLKQNGENLSWEQIAKEIKQNCQNSCKNGRQCRDKYINYTRFNEDQKMTSNWTAEEDRLFIKLYKESGPCWSKYVKIIPNKSENCFKNRFYNSVRRVSKLIEEHQKNILKCYRSFISYQSIIKILDLCVLIQKQFEENMFKISRNCMIFNCRQQLLQLIFIQNCLPNENQITQLIEQLKILINKLKCFGIFKTKNKKAWKITQKLVRLILDINDIRSGLSSLFLSPNEEQKSPSDQCSKIEETQHINQCKDDFQAELDLKMGQFFPQKILYYEEVATKKSCLFLQILKEDTNQEYQLLLI